MHLQKLDLRGIRNLQQVQLTMHPSINFFYGANGSGKTSLLESIYLLGCGRSFRTRKPLSVMTEGADELLVVGFVDNGVGRPVLPIGMQRKRTGELVLKVAGEKVYALSRLAETLPMLLFNTDSFQLLEGGPKARRSYLDWGVFHVEPGYRELWNRFQRALKQRNSLLRRGRIDAGSLSVWDAEFVQLAEKVNSFRQGYVDRLIPVISEALSGLLQETLSGVSFKYSAGWDVSQPLREVLRAGSQRDQQVGATHNGPHRADLKIRIDRTNVSEILSRGQSKALVSAMLLAQGQLFFQSTGRQCLCLIDDLPSELDIHHRKYLADQLTRLGSQVFVTGVEKADLLQSWPEGMAENCGLFHVEQGKITNET